MFFLVFKISFRSYINDFPEINPKYWLHDTLRVGGRCMMICQLTVIIFLETKELNHRVVVHDDMLSGCDKSLTNHNQYRIHLN